MKQIYSTLQDSFDFLNWEEDWAHEGEDKPKSLALSKAHLFVHLLISKLGEDLPHLEINPCRDGSIDVFFQKEEYKFLMNFKETTANCYGAKFSNNEYTDEIKGENIDSIKDWFSKYMI
jgi:hypothetical protein